MAWRIEEHVVSGEIDNRTRGRVVGKLRLAGRSEPIELELAGNAWRDLAGRRLEFVNPTPAPGADWLAHLAQRQAGVVGDCTASRKVKVPEIPLDQIDEYFAAKKSFPWHWGNSLYLEWFSEANGRVVLESATFRLTVSDAAAWEMSADEEQAQRRANAEALTAFMQRLADAATGGGEVVDDTPAEWNETPLSEEAAEKMQAESDLLADRINARVEREGIEHYKRILEEELARRRRERGEPPLAPEQEAEQDVLMEEMNRAAEEAANNPDSEREEERTHPLADRAFEFSLRINDEPEARGWIPKDATPEHPVAELVGAVMSAGVKLAGALNGERWPPDVDFCATKLVRLKRARDYLTDALAAAAACREENLVDSAWLAEAEGEIQGLARECDLLIAELRSMLEREGKDQPGDSI